jgi:GNAT superfamily N-acetyltransferase
MDSIAHARSGYRISADTETMDLDAIHAYLSVSYWAQGIPRDMVARAIRGSLCFGLFDDSGQVGFARVVTDRATFAYLCDVYVLDAHRGRGLASWLMESIIAHPDLHGLRRFVLATRDAHGLYERFGFVPLARPASFMEINRPDIYSPARHDAG